MADKKSRKKLAGEIIGIIIGNLIAVFIVGISFTILSNIFEVNKSPVSAGDILTYDSKDVHYEIEIMQTTSEMYYAIFRKSRNEGDEHDFNLEYIVVSDGENIIQFVVSEFFICRTKFECDLPFENFNKYNAKVNYDIFDRASTKAYLSLKYDVNYVYRDNSDEYKTIGVDSLDEEIEYYMQIGNTELLPSTGDSPKIQY